MTKEDKQYKIRDCKVFEYPTQCEFYDKDGDFLFSVSISNRFFDNSAKVLYFDDLIQVYQRGIADGFIQGGKSKQNEIKNALGMFPKVEYA